MLARQTFAVTVAACAFAILSCSAAPRGPLPTPAGAKKPAASPRTPADEIAEARELDNQGARSFGEGHFREARSFFEEARKRGAPAQELWNMARCEQKLDDFEAAATLLDEYIRQKDLSPTERDQAKRELADLRKRPSRVTVLSSPSGAVVYLGEKRGGPVGKTPTTFDVPPGPHVVSLELAGFEPATERVNARWGRSIVVESSLSK